MALPKPIISGITPSSATPGQLVVITGENFTGATSVMFGGYAALTFFIVSDTQINAYPNISAGEIISVGNVSGSGSFEGFTLIAPKIKMPDSPPLGRAVDDLDLLWIWDTKTARLTQTTADQLPAGTGGGGGGGGTGGNIYTALGSPFKVRNYDDSYQFDGVDSIITDIRLLGKTDYVVYSTDVNSEFDTFNDFSSALTATASGTTGAPDGVYPLENAVTITGLGAGSQWYVKVLSGSIVGLIQRSGGSDYVVGDTFSIVDIPGVTFTITALGEGLGNLIFDEAGGSVRIKNYQLSDNKHITIYADGVVSTAQQSYLLSTQSKMDTYDKVIAPVIATGGIVWPWRKAANLIPAGWQECTDFRGKIPIGQDPSDDYNATTNPYGLNQAVGTNVGSKTVSIQPDNIPPYTVPFGLDNKGGGGGEKVLSKNQAGIGSYGTFPMNVGGAGDDLAVLSPSRIVYWIEYVG